MGSPFAKFFTDTIPVPDDAPHTVTIQKLSGGAIQRAQQIAAAEAVNGRGFAENVSKMLQAAKNGDDLAAVKLIADPLNGFDRATLLVNGITGWSYTDISCTAENIRGLDDERSEHFARAILKLAKPHLFAEPEQERKNV